MGRYYYGNNFEGKFSFGVQPSDDPGTIFNMEEQEPAYVEYYLGGTEENIEMVKKKIDEQFDILGVEKEERKYDLKPDEIGDYVYDIDRKYLYRDRDPDNEYDQKAVTYACSPEEEKMYPHGMIVDTQEKALASSRIILGLKILTDLRDGDCYLNAEV